MLFPSAMNTNRVVSVKSLISFLLMSVTRLNVTAVIVFYSKGLSLPSDFEDKYSSFLNVLHYFANRFLLFKRFHILLFHNQNIQFTFWGFI